MCFMVGSMSVFWIDWFYIYSVLDTGSKKTDSSARKNLFFLGGPMCQDISSGSDGCDSNAMIFGREITLISFWE